MEALTGIALDVAERAKATFADIRIVEESQNHVYVKRRSLQHVSAQETVGYAVRVLLDGAWGFASSTEMTREGVARCAKQAVAVARASAAIGKGRDICMAPESAHVEVCAGPCQEDPFAVPDREKAQLLLDACNRMLDVPHVVNAFGYLQFIRQRRIIANTDGTRLDLTNTFSNPMLMATAVVGQESQSRSCQAGAKQAGYEFIRSLDLAGRARHWAEQAVEKCHADDCPSGVMDLVLDPVHLALTMHESVGHPTELDRILGWEANMAGASFVTPEDVDTLKYGSDFVNFTADGDMPDALGSWFYDDDGVKLKTFPVIRNGLLVNLGMTRETAPIIGQAVSNGCCRADSFEHAPINRIPNLYLEPGTDDTISPERLIAGVSRGVYIEGMGSFSIDQMRRNFQFGGDMFWMIENGRLTRPLKKVTYQAQTCEFWNRCDGLAGRPWWQGHGVMNCGKGEPMQVMRMTHGASHSRFRGIQVGSAHL